MDSIAYWNDEAQERAKPWWIDSIHDQRLLDHLQANTNLRQCFEAGLTYADERFQAVQGTVLDLGAGVCWTTAIVSRWPHVENVHALDYSQHRLWKVAPLVFIQLGAVEDKIERHCQPISPLAYPDESVDFVIFCQALYMSESPESVLHEVYRVLRPGGVVMVSCESIETPGRWVWRWSRQITTLLRHPLRDWKRALTGRLPDASGRYQYFDAHYAAFIANAGFMFVRQSLPYPVFKDSSMLAANYFGVKPRRESRSS